MNASKWGVVQSACQGAGASVVHFRSTPLRDLAMITVFGWRSVRTKNVPAEGVTCVSCQTVGSTQLEVRQEYLHIFWVPIFPMRKFVVASCSRCGAHFADRELPPAYQPVATAAAQRASIPIWTFVGLPVVLFAVAAAFHDRFGFGAPAELAGNSAKVKACLEHVAPGQVYELNMGPPSYSPKEVKSLIRITQADSNSVSFEKGLVQKYLDQPLLAEGTGGPFDGKAQKLSRAEFAKKALLDCR
ncbi:hypothetical protein AKJ09_01937 [Labilithrix luteola]|uniref:Zinc-ribbon 15 domain-containing protein n=1 Tax=Labilithrix luteola TaxID=1391654 RepID=A0A0K1PP27_9BACT|nr:zinc-ribbon domain-containing protein [Labilithrix luteola]AKU95273.1 hypothetical protein AKJ09_01937 [Labilithrix luteola]